MVVRDAFVAMEFCRLFVFPTALLSCVIVASAGARVFVALLLDLLRPLNGLVFPVFIGVKLKRLVSPTVFASCVIVASAGARVFAALLLALRHRLSGLAFPVLRGVELKK